MYVCMYVCMYVFIPCLERFFRFDKTNAFITGTTVTRRPSLLSNGAPDVTESIRKTFIADDYIDISLQGTDTVMIQIQSERFFTARCYAECGYVTASRPSVCPSVRPSVRYVFHTSWGVGKRGRWK